jgi:hypothetical protein
VTIDPIEEDFKAVQVETAKEQRARGLKILRPGVFSPPLGAAGLSEEAGGMKRRRGVLPSYGPAEESKSVPFDSK